MIVLDKVILGRYTLTFTQLIWRQKTLMLGLVFTSLCIGFFAHFAYVNFLHMQAQNSPGLSVFNEILLPLSGLSILCQLFLTLLVCLLYPYIHSVSQTSLFEQASIGTFKLLIKLLKPIIWVALWPVLVFLLVILFLSWHSQLDWSRIFLLLLGLCCIGIINANIIFSICFINKRIVQAIIFTIGIVFLLIAVEIVVNIFSWQTIWTGVFLPFYSIREGLIVYADWIGYLGWIIISSTLAFFVVNRKQAFNKVNWSTSLIIGLLIILLAHQFSGQWDISNNQRNSFSEHLVKEVNQFNQPLEIIAVIDKQTSRDEILYAFNLLKRRLTSSELKFQSRQSMPAELSNVSEFVQFKLGELEQTIAYPFSQNVKSAFESAIEQMLLRKKHWVTFIEGHGEASLFAKKTAGLGELYKALTTMGWSVAAQNLATRPTITDNTQLIVVASSQTQWLPAEVDRLVDYLKQGKNLLWMMDPDSVMPQVISELLGIKTYPGSLVDWQGYQSGTPHPAIVIVNQLEKHPTVASLTSLLAFPWSSGLLIENSKHSKIKLEPMLLTHSGVWNELNIQAEELVFNQEQGEKQQAFILAAAYENKDSNQRIVILGDSSFASDSAINNYANKDFALNLIHWLTYHKIDKAKQIDYDNAIRPTVYGHWVMRWFFSLCLPALVFIVWLSSYFFRMRKPS